MKKLYMIKPSKKHGSGMFALESIPKETTITQYKGKIVSSDEGDRRKKKSMKKGTLYIFKLDSKRDVDGDVPENDARFANHSCSPNCEVQYEGNGTNRKLWLVSLRNIKKGDEITYNYGFEYEGEEEYMDHPCRCGSKNCIGIIASRKEWGKIRKFLKSSSFTNSNKSGKLKQIIGVWNRRTKIKRK